jgi:hypothetical protein
MWLERKVNAFCETLTRETEWIRNSILGKILNWSILLGPFTFLPTLVSALILPNIEALQTSTWGLMTVVNIGGALSLAKNGEWIMRLVGLMWVVQMAIITLVVFVRSI